MNYQKEVKIIGFDLDQTLCPKSPEIDKLVKSYIYRKIAEYRQCRFETAKRLFLRLYPKKMSGSEAIRMLAKITKEKARRLVQEALERTNIDRFLIPDERVISLLKELKNRYVSVDLITGSPKNSMFHKIKRLGLADIFNHCIDGEQASKSDGDAYQMWLNLHHNLKPGQFLYIGDEKNRDYQSANRFGIPVIMVNVSEDEKDNKLDCLQLPSLLEIRDYLL